MLYHKKISIYTDLFADSHKYLLRFKLYIFYKLFEKINEFFQTIHITHFQYKLKLFFHQGNQKHNEIKIQRFLYTINLFYNFR